MTIDDDYRVHISARVPHNDINDYWMYQFEGRYITFAFFKSALTRVHRIPPETRVLDCLKGLRAEPLVDRKQPRQRRHYAKC